MGILGNQEPCEKFKVDIKIYKILKIDAHKRQLIHKNFESSKDGYQYTILNLTLTNSNWNVSDKRKIHILTQKAMMGAKSLKMQPSSHLKNLVTLYPHIL